MFKKLFGKKKTSLNETMATELHTLSMEEVESCLLQQTTTYQRGTPIIIATNNQNDLLLIYYFENTFYIVKVVYENNNLNIICDYRKKSLLLEEFQYRITNHNVTATLKLMNEQVEFVVTPQIEYCGHGCKVYVNQEAFYGQFVACIDKYRENINVSAMMRKQESGYLELLEVVRCISDKDRIDIFCSLDEGQKVQAIQQIKECTGLKLGDCKKIADNPYMYL